MTETRAGGGAGREDGRAGAPSEPRVRQRSWPAARTGAIPAPRADRPAAWRRGDLITMDFGALYGGYHADHDPPPSLPPGEPGRPGQREIYELVAAAQRVRP